MSTAEFGDLSLGQAPAPAPEPLTPLTLTPPAPVVASRLSLQLRLRWRRRAAPIPVADMRDVPLGTLIFREGLLTEEQLEEALQDGMQRGKRLGEVLLERGLVSENDLGRLLAGQKGLQFVRARRGHDRSSGGAAAVGREGAPAHRSSHRLSGRPAGRRGRRSFERPGDRERAPRAQLRAASGRRRPRGAQSPDRAGVRNRFACRVSEPQPHLRPPWPSTWPAW